VKLLLVPFRLATSTTEVSVPTSPTLTVKFALVAPASTVTDEGIVRVTPIIVPVPSATVVPPVGAAPESVTVQVEDPSRLSVDGLHVKPFKLGLGSDCTIATAAPVAVAGKLSPARDAATGLDT